MPGIQEVHLLPYSAEQMFDLVADVGRYPEFLPWVVAARVRRDTEEELIADLLVGFKAFNEKFTSRVEKVRPGLIRVDYLHGPMRNLENIWKFNPMGSHCEVDFHVDFNFRSSLFETLAGQYFDRAFRKMVGAFEARAAALYGSNNSSATSTA